MRILIVSAHPAQVHGFRLVRDELLKAGHQVFWATTDKDIAINLLRQFGIEYFLILKAPKNFFSRVWYMLRNVCRLRLTWSLTGTNPSSPSLRGSTALSISALPIPSMQLSNASRSSRCVRLRCIPLVSTNM